MNATFAASPAHTISKMDSSRHHDESASRLTRLRALVDAGVALDESTDVPFLREEMARASAATEPAAGVLAAAADERSEQLGYDLNYFELELLWRDDPALAAVKRLYDRERARWRRANGILGEHEMLLHGEAVEIDRRAPYRLPEATTVDQGGAHRFGSAASPALRRRLAGLSRWAR